jgi:ATP citrate (pro-S)-lyase
MKAKDANMSPDQFVEDMKRQGKRIPGIGHRIKSADNLDKRVILMKDYAIKNFPSTDYLNFALEVEQFTLKKANNLVLNVDGCIGSLFLDLMKSCPSFSDAEMKDIIDTGYLNGLFVLARTIGLVGR